MSDRNIFAEREHWLEEEYFRKKNQELVEKIHRQQERQIDGRMMSEAIDVFDQDVIDALQDIGYTEKTVRLVYLIPLVQVAWSEGGVADRERSMILKVAETRGIDPDSHAHQQLIQWLTVKPSDRFFEENLHAIRVIFGLLPPEQREIRRRDLIDLCSQIASIVEGGILGRAQISDDEHMLITHITKIVGSSQ